MAKSRTFFLLCILFLSVCVGSAQIKRANHWYFGWRAGLDFNSGTAVADTTGELRSIEAACSISDTLGNLLFYCEGFNVWNKNHVVMPNGSGIVCSESSAQGVIIAPKPLNDSLYYLFTTGSGSEHLRYNIINMNLNSGLGDVMLPKNNVIRTDGTEGIAGTKHCNGRDYWIMTRKSAQDTLMFYAYLVTPTGINSPVVTKFAHVIAANVTVDHLTFSQNGNTMVFSAMGHPLFLFTFNKSTGQLALNSTIPNISGEYFYSTALSPDATKLYVTGWKNFDYNRILQYDLSAANIPASRTGLDSVVFNGSNTGYGWIGSVRLAPDQKIYISRWHMNNPWVIDPSTAYSLDSLAVIQNPNTLGLACNYQRNSFYLKGKTTQMSLPNFISNFTSTVVITANPVTVSLNSSSICPGATTILTSQVSPSNSSTTYTWLPNGSNSQTIQVSPTANTIYTITGYDGSNCIYTSTTAVFVFGQPTVSINNATVCPGTPTILSAQISATNSPGTYTWLPGGFATSTLQVSPTAITIYTIVGADNHGCAFTNTTTVFMADPLNFSVSNATICPGTPTLLTAISNGNSVVTYTWFPGGIMSSVNNVNPTVNTTYTINGSDNFGCSFTNTAAVLMAGPLNVTVNDVTVCPGNSATLQANVVSPNTNITYTWFPGSETTSSIVVSPTSQGIYSVFVSMSTCTGSGTANVMIASAPQLQFVAHHTIIEGDQLQLHVSGANSYTWNTEPSLSCLNCSNPIATPLNNIVYCVTAGNELCYTQACMNVEVICGTTQLPLPNAFTPNGDGENDLFCIKGWDQCVKNFSIVIFDRWGEKVFESNDPGFCWDGIYKGITLSTDVYTYSIEAEFFNTKTIARKGNITLIK